MTMTDEEKMVQVVRASLWMALCIVLLIGAAALMMAFAPPTEVAGLGQSLMKFIPILIVIAVGNIVRKTPRTPGARALLQATISDELRQQSIQRATRNGLLGALAIQGPAMFLAEFARPGTATMVMATLTITTGLAVLLASVLWHDR